MIKEIEAMMAERGNAVGFFEPGETKARFIVCTPALWAAMWRRLAGGGAPPLVEWGEFPADPDRFREEDE
jgi:hypothetical protein